MAQSRPPKQKKNPVPINIVYIENDGDFKLYKQWNKKTIAKDPYYICDNLEELIEEIEAGCMKWGIRLNLKELHKFINIHKNDQNEETNFPKSYLSQ